MLMNRESWWIADECFGQASQLSESRKSFGSDVLSYENELIGETGIDTSHYPTREPESEHKQQHLNKP